LNKRIFILIPFFWPFFNFIIYYPFQMMYPIVIRYILFGFLACSILLWIFFSPIMVMFMCTPKSNLPLKINMINFCGDIKCNQKSHSKFDVIFSNKSFEVDMSSWLFKKSYIRDIILMYYHLDYYNRKKLKQTKCISKKYFKGENMFITFNLLNGKQKKMFLIKNGKEKRTFICSLKIFFMVAIKDRRIRHENKYTRFEVLQLYL